MELSKSRDPTRKLLHLDPNSASYAPSAHSRQMTITGMCKRFLQELARLRIRAQCQRQAYIAPGVQSRARSATDTGKILQWCADAISDGKCKVHTLASVGWNKQPSARFAGRAMNRQHLQWFLLKHRQEIIGDVVYSWLDTWLTRCCDNAIEIADTVNSTHLAGILTRVCKSFGIFCSKNFVASLPFLFPGTLQSTCATRAF